MRMQLALETGSPEPRAAAPTFAEFVSTTFRPLRLHVKCRPATRERYEYLLQQGILERLPDLPPLPKPGKKTASAMAGRSPRARSRGAS